MYRPTSDTLSSLQKLNASDFWFDAWLNEAYVNEKFVGKRGEDELELHLEGTLVM